jgi:hypothetical protein
MTSPRLTLLGVLALCCAMPLAASPKARITVSRNGTDARPAETVSIPYSEVKKAIPGLLFEHVLVRDASGAPVPYQITNYTPERRPAVYDELLVQVTFPAGAKEAELTVEESPDPVAPFPSRVFARHVPERLDDFAFENDRIGHRIYGPALSTPAAEKGLLVGSGIDVWAKRVSYLIVDRWYLRGHDSYHKDTGEGMDLYAVNNSRGCGGTGVWDGSRLLVSANWKTAKVIANGPIRAIFELSYEAWDAGNSNYLTETKRFTVDAGSNLHRVDCRYQIYGKAPSLQIGIGIAKHTGAAAMTQESASDGSWLATWEKYEKDGQMGCAIVLAPSAPRKGVTEDALNKLVISETRAIDTLSYYFGAGWDRSGQYADLASWRGYVAAFAERLKDPFKVSVSQLP